MSNTIVNQTVKTSFDKFTDNLVQYVRCLIFFPKSDVIFSPIEKIDIQILRGLLSECDYHNRFTKDRQQLMKILNEEQKITKRMKRTSDQIEEGVQVIANSGSFEDYHQLIKDLSFNLLIFCLIDIFMIISHVFSSRSALNDKWILFLYSVFLLVTLSIIQTESYYCLLGKGRVRNLRLFNNIVSIFALIDFSLFFRTVLATIPTMKYSSRPLWFWLKVLLLLMCYSGRTIQMVVMRAAINNIKQKTVEYKTNLVKYLIKS